MTLDEAIRFLEKMVLDDTSAEEMRFHLFNLLPVIAAGVKSLRGNKPGTNRFGSTEEN